MSDRPSNVTFLNWAMNDDNKATIQRVLEAYPDLANIKNHVSLILKKFFFLSYISIKWYINGLMYKKQ